MAKNHNFPHLLPDDVVVWKLFLDSHYDLFDVIDYDVRVGEGRPMPDLPTANLQRMAVDLSQRRIDAVGHLKNSRIIIEITHTLGLKAIGQIQSYPTLYKTKYPGNYSLRSLLVAGSIESDMIPVLRSLKIAFWTPNRAHLMNQLLNSRIL